MIFQSRSKHKMTVGAERVAHINSPAPRFGVAVFPYTIMSYCHLWKA